MSKILVVTVCRNESRMIDWFMRHYSFADAIHIWDNSSTDGSFDYFPLPEEADVQVYKYDTGGVLCDDIHAMIKSTHYRTQPLFDWVIAVDVDEFIYHPRGVRQYLEELDQQGIVLPQTQGFQMVGGGFLPFDRCVQLTDLITTGVPDELYSKLAVFRSSVSMQYGAGCHNVSASAQSTPSELKLLHYKWFSEELSHERASKKVLSGLNKLMGWGIDQANPEHEKSEYRRLREQRKKVI